MSATATHPGPRQPDAMIRLENLTKRFPGQRANAVDSLTLDIPAGEIVILVGPSGCGKTTTLRLINRLIEPTSGKIFLEGEDVTSVNPDRLRRRMGYVIQQVGLFPHETIAENIATVPRLLGWDRKRISRRIDELIEMVGMDPSDYRNRYPKELSGGQRQRVGVARALAADPPVILMDEPFSAIDPITRKRLQNEFLQLQAEIQKTIVFVTHDIDEAIKMGDRIAILAEGSTIAQYDDPETILTAPASRFVEDFIGSGASLKRLNLTRVADVELAHWPVAEVSSDRARLREALLRSDKGSVLLLDADRRPRQWVNAIDLERTDTPLGEAGTEPLAQVDPQSTLHDALNEMLTSYHGAAIVVDADGTYLGVIEIETVTTAIKSMRVEARRRYRGEDGEARPEEVATTDTTRSAPTEGR